MSGSWGLLFIQQSRQRKNPLPLCDMRGSRLHSPLLGLGRYLCRPSRRLSLIPYLLDTVETRVFEQLQAYSGFSSLLFRYAPPLEYPAHKSHLESRGQVLLLRQMDA
jgi:hypothetical protein